jgi:hypothetical protein
MRIKDYLLVIIILLFISILFVPTENSGIAVGIGITAILLAIIYFWIRKK